MLSFTNERTRNVFMCTVITECNALYINNNKNLLNNLFQQIEEEP